MLVQKIFISVIFIGNSIVWGQQPACLPQVRYNCLFDIPGEERTAEKCRELAPRCRFCPDVKTMVICQTHDRACIVPDRIEVPGNLTQEECEGQSHVYCWGDVECQCVYPEPARKICFKRNDPEPCSNTTATTERDCHETGCVWCGEGSRSTTIDRCWALHESATCADGGNCCQALTCSSNVAECEEKGCFLCNDGGKTRCVYKRDIFTPPPVPGLPICQNGNVEDCLAGISIIPTEQLCQDLCCTWCSDNGLAACRRENYPEVCSAPINYLCPVRNLESFATCKSHGCDWCGESSNIVHCQASTTCTTCNCPNAVDCCAETEAACGAKGCLWCDELTADRSFHCMNLNSDGILPSNPTVFSECTRTCGGGTKWRYTDCGDIHPFTCPREYVTCNTEPCEIDICDEGERVRADGQSTCCLSHSTTCGRNILNERACNVASNRKKRVTGGSDVDSIQQWPWVVHLTFDDTDSCSGTLASEKDVITAASCIGSYIAADITVLLSTHDLMTPSPLERSVSAVFTNGSLSILTLSQTVSYSSYLRPICMPRQEVPFVDSTCYVAGWGQDDAGNPTSVLKDSTVRISSWTLCEEAWGALVPELEPQRYFCAGIPEGGQDACTFSQGDEGSPLMCQRCQNCGFYIAGVVKEHVGCGVPAKPTLYATVQYYEGWAETIFSTLETETYSSC